MGPCVATTSKLPQQFKAGTLVALYDVIHGGRGHTGNGEGQTRLFLLFVDTKLQAVRDVTSNYQLTVVVQIAVCVYSNPCFTIPVTVFLTSIL
jgi:hypothetical protein